MELCRHINANKILTVDIAEATEKNLRQNSQLYVVACVTLWLLVPTPISVLAPTLTWYVLPSCRPLMVVLVDPLPGSVAVM